MNLLVEVEIRWQTEFGRVWLKKKKICLFLGWVGVGWDGGVGMVLTHFFLHESSSWVEIRLHTEFGRAWMCRS